MNRKTFNFNPDWLFTKSDMSNASHVECEDSHWETVSLPHTFNDRDTFRHFQTRNHTGEREQWSGRTWYRKHFLLPLEYSTQRIVIEFEGVRQLAEVYINGICVGENCNGFIPFGFDLTAHIRFGETNTIAVMCDNSFVEDEVGKVKWSSYEGGAKVSWNNPHWHPPHGGIYRNVFLHVLPELHLTLPLYSNLGTVGSYVYTKSVSKTSAIVGVDVEVKNNSAVAADFEIALTVHDEENKNVMSCKTSCSLGAQNGHIFNNICGEIINPHLWDPERPYLYKAQLCLLRGKKVIDSISLPLGVRFWHFCAKGGFFINGRRLKLQGWGQKSTNEWAGLGAALPNWMHHYTLQQMKEAGGNHVRWGHTAGGPIHIEAADRLGLITVQPGVDGEGDLEGPAWTIRANAFRDMIIYYRNHPSIFVWEGGNQAVSREHLEELTGFVKKYDPHGKRNYAHRRPDSTTAESIDLEIGTQGGHKFKTLPIIEGEYNREECPRRVWDQYSPPDFGYKVPRPQEYELTSESFAVNQVSEYVLRLGRRSHSGGANWIFSDSTSGGRNDCEVTRASGVVDAVRLPKEAYFACRAIFDTKPQVHIVGHWTYPEAAKTCKDVFVISNCPQVQLELNGKPLEGEPVQYRHLFRFKEVHWEPGFIKATGIDANGTQVAHQTKHTVGPTSALRLTPIAGPSGWLADGSDILLIDVEAIDAHGNRHPTTQCNVSFTLEGHGVWRGGYNSGVEHSTNHQHLMLECGVNRVAIKSTRDAGSIVVTAIAEGLAPATLHFTSTDFDASEGLSELLPCIPKRAALPPLELVDEEEDEGLGIQAQCGRFIEGFSYSGSRLSLPVLPNAEDGLQLYVDEPEHSIDAFPEAWRGADYVQTALSEKLYEAVDLMDFSVNTDGLLYIVRDARLSTPGWLKAYKLMDTELTVSGNPMQVFRKTMTAHESATLGANRESGPSDCLMYSVLFLPTPLSTDLLASKDFL